MTVTLQVSQVRDALYRAAGGPDSAGPGHSSTALLGKLFHEIFAALTSETSEFNIAAALAEADSDPATWQGTLEQHAYHTLVGPRLLEHQASLQESGEEVLAFWKAVREACGWLAELAQTVHERSENPSPGIGRLLLPTYFSPEHPLEWELRETGWTDSVRLVGVADNVVQIPNRAPWCVVELKLGRTAPEADLAQACLYHQMLRSSLPNGDVAGSDGALAVVGFMPERHEQVFPASKLAEVQDHLKRTIGALAGVVSSESVRPPKEEVVKPKTPPLKKERKRSDKPDPEQIDQGRKLVATFREYGAPVELEGEPIVGPTFLRYPVVLGHGVKLAAVKNRAEEVQMRLGLAAPPLINMAHGQVVIDVQRPDREYVLFSEIADCLPEPDPVLGCPQVPIGIDLNGELQFANLSETEHCHILAAGTTGSGKSEWLRSALAGLLATNTPETLRLLLIDPKRNAFWELKDSPYLLRPIVYPDEQSVAEILCELADEMDARYAAFEGADSLDDHIRRTGKSIPRIVCVCDEYYDVVHGGGREERKAIEQQVFRLGAKARAAGIHMILATQQPSRDVIKGVLDANIPARVGLKTSSPIESSMLLNTKGAEALLGNGDLLFKDIGVPVRLQSPYLPPEEREKYFSTDAAVQQR